MSKNLTDENVIEVVEGYLDFRPVTPYYYSDTVRSENIMEICLRTAKGEEQELIARFTKARGDYKRCYLRLPFVKLPFHPMVLAQFELPELCYVPITEIQKTQVEDEYGFWHSVLVLRVNIGIVMSEIAK